MIYGECHALGDGRVQRRAHKRRPLDGNKNAAAHADLVRVRDLGPVEREELRGGLKGAVARQSSDGEKAGAATEKKNQQRKVIPDLCEAAVDKGHAAALGDGIKELRE